MICPFKVQENILPILEDFNLWLEEMSRKYDIPKEDVQELIKIMLSQR